MFQVSFPATLYRAFKKDGPDLKSLNLCNHKPPMNETLTT
jgi:hypothetical protein